MTRTFHAVFAVLLTLVVAAPAAAQEIENVDRTLTLQPGGRLKLNTFSGRVRISGVAGDQVVIKAIRRASRDRLNDIKLEITQSGNSIEIQANRRVVERRNDNVVETDFDIQVPSKTELDIKTFSAPVTVTGVSGRLNVDSFSASVRIEASDWADGNDLDINTFSGGIILRMPDSARGELDFNSFSGEFESDLPVTLQSSGRRNFRGALNGGGSTDFRLKTFSGDVSIRR
ncbi:MAG: DUF4097 family beta strand repeat-containing protein [Vicinamibacterales bacterium]